MMVKQTAVQRLALVVLALAVTAGAMSTAKLAEGTNFPGRQGSVLMVNGQPMFKAGLDTSAVAFGSFDEAANHASGFGVLKIETNPSASDHDQYFAAGFLEGFLTNKGIYDQYINVASSMSSLNNGIPEPLLEFLAAQFNWTRSQVAANQDDVFWQQVGLIMAQYDGLRAGYGANVYDKHVLPEFAFQLLNGNGDFFDIIPKVLPSEAVDVTKMSSREFHDWRMRNGRCSALIKLTGDFSDLFMSHSAWYIYQAMNRIYKHYNFQATITHAKKISFSSYPGYLESLDDFYLMSSGLVMLQTTNNVFNTNLQQYIQPESLQSWIRIRTATALAQTSEDWAELAGRHNSGTYNNQYMVMDLNKFTPGQPLLDGTLYVAEQIPGTWEYADMTKMLSLGYWPSYNVPFFEKIYNLSGYPAVVKQHGTDDSYELAPRAKIFRRDQTTVVDLDSFKAIMRYNDYKNDPYAKGDPYNAICSRGDLESDSPSPGGCYDTKVTTYSMALKLQSQVINGPTTSHGLPPFSWSQFPNASHLGMPEVFNFTFETMDAGW